MEAGERDKVQIVHVTDNKCELCDTNDIFWKCLNCDELMCDFCKKTHLRSKMTRKHKVEYLGEAEIRPASQSVKLACSTHSDEKIQMFCKPCSKPICRECIASEAHLCHKLAKIEDVIRLAQNEISNIPAQSQAMINAREDSIKHMKKNQGENSSQMSVVIEEIKLHNNLLRQKLDTITDDFIEEIETLDQRNKDITRITEKNFEEAISMLKCLVEQWETRQEERLLDMIQFVTDTKKELEDLKSADPPDLQQPPKFIAKDGDEQNLKAVFGDLIFNSAPKQILQHLPVKPIEPLPKASFDVRVISKFAADKHVGVISTVNDNQAWLCSVGGRAIRLVTSEGDEVKRITTDFGVHDIAVTKFGELLATVHGGYAVKKFTENGSSVDLWTIGDQGYKTCGITVTNNNDIVVALYCYIADRSNGEYQYEVLLLSSSGQLIRKLLQYNRTINSRLVYFNPCSVSSNINGDTIVGLQPEGCVIVIDKSGGKKFTYYGQVQSFDQEFSPRYSVTDKYGHVLISDHKNSAVHMLSKDGNFMKLLVSEEHGLDIPHGMSIDTSGRLWIWHRDSTYGVYNVMVLKYS